MSRKKNDLRGIGKSFFCAFRGIVYGVRHERNLRFHLVAAAYVFYFAGFYDFSRAEYAILALVCAFVIAAELFNTAVEVMIDKISPRFNVFAMIGKDLAAGAVLVSAVAALVAGIALFWDIPTFVRIFEFFTSGWLPPLLLLASAVLSVLFVFSATERGGKPK
ncbi:MAG: diacylglycerol kinase family protein [Bacteroides sp.]|nr:diacylglycerol kinase family protein [Eubacterium sp.]MCM1417922.1 diacylglycerol kinase family protein [Roseburia sp.]MCM1461915.1 diacylglycerol kinase family protein [Bacteroides sp.]